MAEAKAKKENYNSLQVTELKNAFKGVTNFEGQKAVCEQLSQSWGGSHSPRQIMAKLQHLARSTSNNEVVYFKKEYTPKQGAGVTVIKKSLLVSALADKIGCEDEALASLEGATKSALMLLLGAFDKLDEFRDELLLANDLIRVNMPAKQAG